MCYLGIGCEVITAILEPIPVTLNHLFTVMAELYGCHSFPHLLAEICRQWGLPSSRPKSAAARGHLEHCGRNDYFTGSSVGGLHAAAIFFRRNDDNGDAGDPRECVGCGRTHPQAAGHRSGNDGSIYAFSTFCSFRRARSFSRATLWWLRRETRPRPPHGSMSWTGGRRSLSLRRRHACCHKGPPEN
jgi:hypothetical protein